MKLNFKQSTYVVEGDRFMNPGDVAEVENEAVAESLIAAGYAEKVVEEKAEKPAPKKTKAPKSKDGE